MNTSFKCNFLLLKNISISLIIVVVLAVTLVGCEKEKRTKSNPDPPAGSLDPNALTMKEIAMIAGGIVLFIGLIFLAYFLTTKRKAA